MIGESERKMRKEEGEKETWTAIKPRERKITKLNYKEIEGSKSNIEHNNNTTISKKRENMRGEKGEGRKSKRG